MLLSGTKKPSVGKKNSLTNFSEIKFAGKKRKPKIFVATIIPGPRSGFTSPIITYPIHPNLRECIQIFADTKLTCRSGWFHTWTHHSPAWAWSRLPAGGRGSGRCWCSARTGARGWSQSTGSRCLPKRAKKMLVSTSPGKFVTQWKQANRPSS